jgi:SAM-dependent methyltransferase
MSGYGPLDIFLASGKRDVDNMRNILAQSGTSITHAERVLDFGCSSARMVRWLLDEVKVCEIWGTDISSSHIIWCNQYLSPPFHFVPCTVYPHLPFEDRYFGLVYAGSVFTHIDDLADTWFLELRRILRPGGRLYITIHDRNTIALLDNNDLRGSRFSQLLHSIPEYEEYVNSDFGMFTIQRSVESYVFYDLDFLRKKLEPFFRILSVTKEAYGYQSAVLLERT